MENIYNVNGLVFWTEREIRLRRMFTEHFRASMQDALLSINPAWRFFECEAPLLIPRALVNPNYDDNDIFVQQQFDKFDSLSALRPETTPGSYAYAVHLLKTHQTKTPFVVWQVGKSFRRENDQVSKNMRLKEFYQQEFQCIFTADTKADYHTLIVPFVQRMIDDVVALPSRVVESDRLPSYSLKTLDVEVNNGDKWMEVCSISKRTDFPMKIKFGDVEKELLVLEVAIGSDRIIYNHEIRCDNSNDFKDLK